MRYEIEPAGDRFFVNNTGLTGHPFLNTHMKELGGKHYRSDGGYYSFPNNSRQAVEAIIEEIRAVKQTTVNIPKPATPTTPMPPGWSNAARRRTGRDTTSHPLADGVISRGPGHTVYRDPFNGAAVQIWDES